MIKSKGAIACDVLPVEMFAFEVEDTREKRQESMDNGQEPLWTLMTWSVSRF